MKMADRAETLASISEYGEDSRATSTTGLSYSTYGFTRSPSGDSLNSINTTATNRSYKNGLHGERKSANNNESMASQRRRKNMAHKRNYEFCKKVRVTMALIGILLLVAAIFMLSFYLPKQYEKNNKKAQTSINPIKHVIWDDNIEIKSDMMVLFSTNFSEQVLKSETGPEIALKGYFGELLTDSSKNESFKVAHKDNDSISVSFQGEDKDTSLKISKVDFHDQCYQISWTTTQGKKLQDCFDNENVHWFGLGETMNQVWPIDKGKFKMTPFLTNDYISEGENLFGGVIEPMVINSNGAGIYVTNVDSLYVDMNSFGSKKFCIRSDNRACDGIDNEKYNALNYTICVADDIKKVHKILFDQYIDKPNGVPDKRMITEPIWSTWAHFKKLINQDKILKFAEDIKKHNFPSSHIVIDDMYSTKYGDFDFDPKKFSDVSTMMNLLRSYGFRTIVWIPPFTNLESPLFIKGKNYWVKVGSEKEKKLAPGIVKWWNGMGGVLDTTNQLAVNWFVDRLKEFQKLKIDGFKFDGGEVRSLPSYYVLNNPTDNPNQYSTSYVKLASQFPLAEVRVGYKTQEYPVFVRFLDRRSGWSSQGGLRSLLPAALTFSILGYSFFIPDMVGGNSYIHSPNKELYVRWAQLCVFFPSIQFSIPPWQFSPEVVNMVHEALDIRSNISSYIYELAQNVSTTGEPILRPLWWYWPKDRETFVVDQQFMLGDRYLVAPIVYPNIITHSIYLPAGVWQEMWGENKTLYNEKGKIFRYNVNLRTICYFKLIQIYPS